MLHILWWDFPQTSFRVGAFQTLLFTLLPTDFWARCSGMCSPLMLPGALSWELGLHWWPAVTRSAQKRLWATRLIPLKAN